MAKEKKQEPRAITPWDKLDPVLVKDLRPIKLRERAHALVRVVDLAYTELMEILCRVQENEYFYDWGYNTMVEWVEQDLGFKKRKAHYLMNIWRSLVVEAGVEKEAIEEVEWTKLRAISRAVSDGVVKPSEAKDLVREAKTEKREEVERKLNQRREESGGGARTSVKQVQAILNPDQYDVWLKTLQKMKRRAGNDDLAVGAVIEMLCLNVLYEDIDKSEDQLAFWIRALERAYPKHHVVVVKGDRAADYLEKAIKKLQEELELKEVPPEIKK